MITATTRRCQGCGHLFDPATCAACPECGRVECMAETEWPDWLKAWLLGRALAAKVEMILPRTDQACWERLLTDAVRGRGATRWAATTADCYAAAVQQARAWAEAGYPPLVDFDLACNAYLAHRAGGLSR